MANESIAESGQIKTSATLSAWLRQEANDTFSRGTTPTTYIIAVIWVVSIISLSKSRQKFVCARHFNDFSSRVVTQVGGRSYLVNQVRGLHVLEMQILH